MRWCVCVCACGGQEQLEETLQKLDALETVKQALERQNEIMSEESEQIHEQLRCVEDDGDRNDLLHQLQVPPRECAGARARVCVCVCVCVPSSLQAHSES